MCGAEYTPPAVNYQKKHRVAEAGEVPPTGERGGRKQGTRGDTYTEESRVGDDLRGDTGVIGFWETHIRCVCDVHVVDIEASSYKGRQPHLILYHYKRRKTGKYLEACLERQYHLMSLVFSVDGGMAIGPPHSHPTARQYKLPCRIH